MIEITIPVPPELINTALTVLGLVVIRFLYGLYRGR